MWSDSAESASEFASPTANFPPPDASTWLVVGHGSVGSTIAQRLADKGANTRVFDPAPRYAIPETGKTKAVGHADTVSADYVVLAVPASLAVEAQEYLSRVVVAAPVVYDWTSSAPQTKMQLANAGPGTWVDVALLDSVDGSTDTPLLAVAGTAPAVEPLEQIGFAVRYVGTQIGAAASVKLTRSLFMKSLEALIVEARAVGDTLDPAGVAWESIQRTLGTEFSGFADVLVRSNQLHAARKAVELSEANQHAVAHHLVAAIPTAAEATLKLLAEAWAARPAANSADATELIKAVAPAFKESAA